MLMVDIVMATFNGENYLEEQLLSIEDQTYPQWRLTVRDDGSSDRTMDILNRFRERMGNDKVRIVRNDPPSGSGKNNFMGLLKDCEGRYIMCCDQDDIWHPDKIQKTLACMRKMEKRYGERAPLMVHTDLRVVNEALHELHPSMHRYVDLAHDGKLAHELIQNQVTGCTVLINRPLKAYLDRTVDTEKILMHDHWLALIAIVFGRLGYLNAPTIDYRQHSDNSVGAPDARSMAYLWQRFRRGKEQFRQDMKMSAEQCGYFCQIYASCIENKKMLQLLDNYASLYIKTKPARIRTFFRYGFWKKGVLRKIMQLIWC